MLRNRDRLEPRQGLRSDPDLREQAFMTLQARENFGFSGARMPKSLKKSRAARAKASHVDYEIVDGGTGKLESEDLPK